MPIQIGNTDIQQLLNDSRIGMGNQFNPVEAIYSGGTSITSNIWTRSILGVITPITISDKLGLGTSTFIGSERLRVSGETNTDTLRTQTGYLDTLRLRNNSSYLAITAPVSTSRTVTFQDKDGIVALLSDTQSLPNYALVSTYTQTNSAISGAVANSHTHSNKTLLDTYNQTNSDLTSAVSLRHSHINKALLDTYTNTNADITSAVTNSHTHSNKALLDTYTQTNANLILAVTNQHAHSNKALLDTYDQTNSDITTAITNNHTHSNKALLDTYLQTEVDLADAVTKKHAHTNLALLETYNQTNANITSAVTNNHTHSNKTILDGIISSGSGTTFLSDAGDYRSVTVAPVGTDTQVIFNDGGTTLAGDSGLVFNKTTNLLTAGALQTSSFLNIENSTTYLSKNVGNDLVFTDANSGSVSLAALVSGATNFWTSTTGGIYYGTATNKVGINTTSLNESLNVYGNIEADQFNSKYYRYNGNWLIGTNVGGPSLLRTSVIAFDNIDTSAPLTLMDLSTRQVEFNGDVVLGNTNNLTVGTTTSTQYLQYNISPSTPSHTEGLSYWNHTSGVVNIMSDIAGCVLQVGLETWVRVYNSTGSTIVAGTAVYVTSASGDLIHIAKAQANSESTSLVTIGLTTDDIPNLSQGFVTISGIVHDINTASLTEGGYVYVSPSVAGGLTSTRPTAPNTVAAIGICTVRDSSVGSIFVNLRVQPTVERLSNVYISGISDNEVLSWDAGNNRWHNRPVTATPPSDGIFDWDAGNNRYQPYATQQPFISFDTSSTNPAITDRLNINATVYSSGFRARSSSYLTQYSDYGYDGASLYNGSDNLNITSESIYYSDGVANRLYLNPVISNSGTPVAYKLDTKNNLTASGAKLLWLGTGGVEKLFVDKDGNINISTGSKYKINNVNLSYSDVGAEASLGNPSVDGYVLSSTTTGVRSWVAQSGGGGVTPIDGILYWDGTAYNGYSTYSSSTFGFFLSNNVPNQNISSNRLSLNGFFQAGSILSTNTTIGIIGYSGSGSGIRGYAVSGKGIDGYSQTGVSVYGSGNNATIAKFENYYNGSDITKNIVEIKRTNPGTYNISGDLLNIIDNPNTSGTVSGKALSVTIGSTERISFNPRVANSGTNKAYILDTHNTLSGTTELLSIQNNTVERFRVTPTTTDIGDIAGGNYSTFESDGTLKFNGNATVFKDLYPSSVSVGSGVNAASFTSYNGANLYAYEFVGTGVQLKSLQLGFQLNHDYKEGSDIVPHLHLYIPDDGTGGVIKFYMNYTWTNIDATGTVSETTVSGTVTRAASAGINHNAILSFGTITGTGKTISSVFMCRIYRDPADVADTFGTSVWLKSADLHYEVDSIGSRGILTK